jgi:integrase
MTKSTPIAPMPTPQNTAPLDPAFSAQEIATARSYVEASRAASTRLAYDGDWRRFSAWCRARGTPALPASPALVAVYLSALAATGRAPPSIGRAQAAIAYIHARAGHLPPHRAEGGLVIAEALAGIRRSRPTPPDRKAPADAEFLMALLGSIAGDGLAARRDRALLSLGMAMAARRSELVALELRDLDWGEQGVRITIRRSKTDQEGAGAVVAVPEGRSLTPLTHLRAWLSASGITAGPVFRPLWKGGLRVRDSALSGHAVARILQARVQAAGLDPTRYGGHSLRAGFVTAAARAGADVWKIQQVSRHKSMQVLAGYVRDARLFDDHAGETFL